LAALLYQTAWMRQFAVVFGTSELAVATVLAAYMAGLAAGAALVGRFVHRVRRPLFVYGVLEFCIAAGALAVVPGLRAIRSLQIMLIGGQPELPDAGGLAQPLFYVAAAFVVLFIPTACMGATLPLLTRFAVRTDQQLGRRVGVLYAVNTLGAVFGTLGAAFLLLPGLGLFRTTLVGVAANVAIFALAVLLTRSSKNEQSSPSTEPAAVPHSPFATRWTLAHNVLPIMLISGLTSFVYEVLWSRLLGQLIGGSVYAFATMLATFLTGITLGSAVASRLARDRVTSWVGFIAVQVGTAATSVAVFYILDSLPELASRWGASADSSLWASAGLCAIVLLPSTLCIGATFPFAVRLLAGEAKEAGPVSASVYAWNTVGGVCGALLAGFVIVPELEFAGTVKFAALTNLGLAFATAAIFPYFGWFPRAALGVASALMLVGFHPQPPLKLLGTSPIADVNYNGDLMFLRVGRSSTVRMTDGNGYYLLQNNGLPEAIVGLKGTPPFGGGLHRWLTALPLVARPQSGRSRLIQSHVGKDREQRLTNGTEQRLVEKVGTEPLQKDSIFGEMLLRELHKLPRIEMRSSGRPGV
ncbi:Spermidine synthase, partial [Durusdinium trenchii]